MTRAEAMMAHRRGVGLMVSALLALLLGTLILIGASAVVDGAPSSSDYWVRASPDRVYASLLTIPGVAEMDAETKQALLAPYVDTLDVWDVCRAGAAAPEDRTQHPEPVEGCLTMWAAYPTNYSADTPVIILAAGSNRDPWNYIGAFQALGKWNVLADDAEGNFSLIEDASSSIDLTTDVRSYFLQNMHQSAFQPTGENIAEQAILLAPQFDKLNCPAYGQGGVSSRDGSKMFRKERWDFEWISSAFSSVVDRQSLTTRYYSLYGYSQGAQFAHRLLLLGDEDPRLTWVLTGAPATWAFVSNDRYPESRYPYGLANPTLQFAKDRMRETLKRRHTVIVGEYDIVPDGVIPRGAIVDQQGINRLERARNFFGNATAVTNSTTSADEGTAHPDDGNHYPYWDFYITPNAGHRNMLLLIQQALVEAGFPFHPKRALNQKTDGGGRTNAEVNNNNQPEQEKIAVAQQRIDDPSDSFEDVLVVALDLLDPSSESSSGGAPCADTKHACWFGLLLLFLTFTIITMI